MAVSLATLQSRSVKNMGTGIHSVVKTTMLEVIRRAYAEGIYVQVSSGYRSNAEQQRLFNQGRTTPGNIVTNARPGQSLHNYGLAIDYFLVSSDGNKALWVVNAQWRRVAAIGKSLGFEWGGDWSSFKDYPHLQMTGGLSLGQLQAGRRPNLKLKFTPGKGGSTPPSVSTSGKKFDANVQKLQKDLIKLGYKLPKSGADGYEGKETENAVKAFQKDNKLAVDGIAGKKTLAKIKELLEGGLSVSQYNELKKIIDRQSKEIEELKKTKQTIPSRLFSVDDSHQGNWAWAEKNGLINGHYPVGFVTREQLGTVLNNFYKQFIVNGSKAEQYAVEALEWAKENGISTSSNPAHLASRQQVITIVKRAIDNLVEDLGIQGEVEKDKIEEE